MPSIFRFFLLLFLCVFVAFPVPPLAPLMAAAALPLMRASLADAYAAWPAQRARMLRYARSKHARARRALRPFIRFLNRRYSRPSMLVSILLISGGILILIACIHSHIRTAPGESYFNYGLKQAALTLLLAFLTTWLFWVVVPVQRLLSNLLATGFVSVLVAASVLLSKLAAVEIFSAYFPFSLSYVPISFNVATVLLAFSFTAFGFVVLAVLFELAVFLILFLDVAKAPRTTVLLLVASLSGFVGAWVSASGMQQALQVRGRLFMLDIARIYDFTSNHMCDTREQESVVFIDHVSDRAIAARFPSMATMTSWDPSEDDLAHYAPYGFRAVRCNAVEESGKPAGWCDDPARFGFCNVRHE